MLKKLSAVSVICLSMGNAFAGDMGPVGYDFGGFYVGLGTGFSTFFNNDSYVDSGSLVTLSYNNPKNRRNDVTGVMFDGVVGYGAMFQENTYFGAKASVYYSPVRYADTKIDTTRDGNISYAVLMRPQ